MTEITITDVTPIDRYLTELFEAHGTDVLFTVGVPPQLRIAGTMRSAEDTEPLTLEDVEKIVQTVVPSEALAEFAIEHDADFSFTWSDRARFRANVFRQRGFPALSLRLIPFEIPTFDDLRLPRIVETFVDVPHGLILTTGPTGAGKSTTLASMIDRINRLRSCHIVTIEDPIEYVHQHRLATISQREVGQDTTSFPRAIRSALRADPDVVLVGEMRDLDTIQSTLTIAETGHLVFGTLHTNDTGQAIDRLVDVFPTARQPQIRVQLAATLTGIIYQQLLPKNGGGLIAAFEVLVATHATRSLIREGKTNQLRNVLMTAQDDGMQTLEASLSELVEKGFVRLEDAQNRSLHPKEIDRGAHAASTM